MPYINTSTDSTLLRNFACWCLARFVALSHLPVYAIIGKDDSGAPNVANMEHISLSFSYTGKYVFCALHFAEKNRSSIGIDAQIDADTPLRHNLTFFFGKFCKSNAAKQKLSSFSASKLIELWTIYETAIKIFGVALAYSIVSKLLDAIEPIDGHISYRQWHFSWHMLTFGSCNICAGLNASSKPPVYFNWISASDILKHIVAKNNLASQ